MLSAAQCLINPSCESDAHSTGVDAIHTVLPKQQQKHYQSSLSMKKGTLRTGVPKKSAVGHRAPPDGMGSTPWHSSYPSPD